MKRLYTLLTLAFLMGFNARSQDLSVSGFLSPDTGACNACNPLLSIVIQNSCGAPIGTSFNVSYSINGSAPHIESIMTFISSCASYSYSFLTHPPICSQGVFHIKVEVDLPGDINPANDTLTLVFTNDTTVVGGTMTGSTTVCKGLNSGNLELTGYTGYIDYWEYSTAGGPPWTALPDSADIYSYLNIDTNTVFHVVIDGGYCPDGVSPWAVINVDDPSDAGFMNAVPDIVCATGNMGDINLTGYTGNIVDWASSTGGAYTSLGNAGNSLLSYVNLTQTTYYYAIVQNGVCPADTSAPFTITVDSPGTAGTVVADTTVCKGATGLATLTGYSGNITYWLSSDDGGNTWTPVSDTDAVHNFLVTDTITYTVVIQNGVCPADTAVAVTIYGLPLPTAVAGADDTIYVNETLCFNATGGLGYAWTPSTFLNDPLIANPCATPTSAGILNYTVTVTNPYGCVDNDVLVLTVIDTLDPGPTDTGSTLTPLVICNFVTPNNDGDNDVWNIVGIEQYPDNAVTVMNNHGQIVFEQSAYKNTWKGDSLPDGSYYYLVRIGALDKLFKGVLTISSSR